MWRLLNKATIHMRARGFTLLEVLLYMAIFAVILGALIALIHTMTVISRVSDAHIEVADNTRFAIEKVKDAVRDATSINEPLVGSGPASVLSVDVVDVLQNPVVFDVASGSLRVSRAGSVPVSLTNSAVIFGSHSFETFAWSQHSQNTIRFMGVITSVESLRTPSTSFDLFFSVQ